MGVTQRSCPRTAEPQLGAVLSNLLQGLVPSQPAQLGRGHSPFQDLTEVHLHCAHTFTPFYFKRGERMFSVKGISGHDMQVKGFGFDLGQASIQGLLISPNVRDWPIDRGAVPLKDAWGQENEKVRCLGCPDSLLFFF